MKIALYIDQGRQQIVFTPETDEERTLLNLVGRETRQVKVHRGEFYACQGGWTRQRDGYDSVILILDAE